MISGVAAAVVTEVEDPERLGRVRVRLSKNGGGAPQWAHVIVAAVGPARLALQLSVGDRVLVAFEHGDMRQPFVIGKVWNWVQPDLAGTQAVNLPTGAVLQAIVEDAEAAGNCSVAADLQRQAAPWLASAECLLKILALLKPLIDVVEQLPTPSPSALQEFAKAAAAIQPCLLAGNAAQALPLVRDLLCLSLRALECLRDRATTPLEFARAAVGIQAVLDLGRPFFEIAGVVPVQLSVVTDPNELDSDIGTLQAAVDALGGCEQ